MKVGIYTLGCKVNTYESEFVRSILENHNYIISSFDEICDIYIINTCTVTNTSDVKSRKIIRQARKKNKDALIIAMGCFIQANKSNIIDEIDIAIGNKDKSRIVEIIEEYYKNNKVKANYLYNNFDDYFEDMKIEKYENKTRAFVRIQDGCENFCTYCIIPYVRGKCRSKEFNRVIDEINTLVNNGFKEIVLTGIHTGNYGVDINSSFANLLQEIVKINNLKRLRISSIEINELTDEVLNIIKNNKVIVDHLHIPIQAASNHVLSLMNRKYTLEEFINRIKVIKNLRENMNITTDVIVGFPEESDEDFNSGIDVLKQIGFTKLHVFPYSMRSGTKASEMKQVDERIKKERVKKLLMISKELEINYMTKFIDKKVEVLIETNNGKYALGHTTNYLHVKIYNCNYKSEDIVEAHIIECSYPFLIGEVNGR
ncbi:MAG: tRNA (N(6)-L-threonylcarbamoyladenosine(37)-C(2))-methylthiotransferase MtaB [bacterium]|nr:tRNA (N(6)-L-threonylcarbamoyladenosine(37)-C(2))-methylthiotransferase MtaB [bacterium]